VKKSRRSFDNETKRAAVDAYVSGQKTPLEVANELNIAVGLLYKWRTDMSDAGKEARVRKLEDEGVSPDHARRILELEEQVAEYQKKVGEQALVIDLLKKLRQSPSFRPESELTGLIEITKALDPKRKRSK
jgi:transposase-like protein